MNKNRSSGVAGVQELQNLEREKMESVDPFWNS
jgi:hypothetical protein